MNKNRRIAVVGSGISGTVTAWLLRDRADVSLFEADTRFGGHTHTVEVQDAGGRLDIDTGFMVYNRPNYPLLAALFEHLDVASYPTDMSFSVSLDAGRFEYAGSDLNGLFGQRRNLLNPGFWGMLYSILRFNAAARRALQSPPDVSETLDRFLDQAGLGHRFRDRYLYPMAAAIWSCPRGEIGRFPAVTFLRFFANHGLINLNHRPQWLTVEGGSSRYMERLIADLGPRARRNAAVLAVERRENGTDLVFAGGKREQFDSVVMACHSDQALGLLDRATAKEKTVLGAVRYQPNRVLLHRDEALMPTQRRVWASWNYLGATRGDAEKAVSVTYWMNSLQRLATDSDYFVSLNPLWEPRVDRVVAEYEYQHPVYSLDALNAQRELHRIQGRDGVWYAGAWTGYGFHEDGMRSGVAVAEALGARIPWAAQVEASLDLTLAPQLVGRAA